MHSVVSTHAVILTALVFEVAFLCQQSDAWMKDERESNGERYRISDRGRFFLLALPHNFNQQRSYLAELNFMIHSGSRSEVIVLEPLDPFSTTPSYKSSRYNVTFKVPVVHNVPVQQSIEKSSTGCAIRITSTEAIVVQVSYFGDITDMFQLPPVEAYASEYVLLTNSQGDGRNIIRGVVNVLMTIAVHELTHVQYDFPGQKGQFKVKCSWNAQCGSAMKTALYLNASTFSYVTTSWKEISSKLQTLSGARIITDKPVLVIAGTLKRVNGKIQLGIAPVEPAAHWGKLYMIVNDAAVEFGMGIGSNELADCTVKHDGFSKSYTLKKNHESYEGFYQFSVGQRQYGYGLLYCTHPVTLMMYSSYGMYDTVQVAASAFQFPLLPLHRWPNFVQFTKPKSLKTQNINYHLHLAVDRRWKSHLTYNDRNMSDFKGWEVVPHDAKGNYFWHKSVPNEPYRVYGRLKMKLVDEYFSIATSRPNVYFVAYVTGVNEGEKVGVGLHLGCWYLFPEDEKKYPCRQSACTQGDNVDNDCDGYYDEEIPDGKDDDGDGLIDEDTFLVQGGLLLQASSEKNRGNIPIIVRDQAISIDQGNTTTTSDLDLPIYTQEDWLLHLIPLVVLLLVILMIVLCEVISNRGKKSSQV